MLYFVCECECVCVCVCAHISTRVIRSTCSHSEGRPAVRMSTSECIWALVCFSLQVCKCMEGLCTSEALCVCACVCLCVCIVRSLWVNLNASVCASDKK